MSLDVYLTFPDPDKECNHCGQKIPHATREVYEANITHNLNSMAGAAGIYEAIWRPEEIGITKAKQLIEPLRAGLEALRCDPVKFQEFNPKNGWGSYESLVRWVDCYLDACIENPEADVRASR